MTTVNTDPDGLECYSDHAHDIRTRGGCDWCGSTDPAVTGHVLPQVKRMKGADPVKASAMVMKSGTAIIFDGVLLDHFTASAIQAVYQALKTEEGKAKLRAMTLTRAATICFNLVK